MRVFLDFEASSLSDRSYPIEVGWAGEDGSEESFLIRPAPGWDDWDPRAEAIHGIPRTRLEQEGEPHEVVAGRMVERLAGHDLHASAPSWDGKWLSVLLRAAGLPRHALRLADTDVALSETASAILAETLAEPALTVAISELIVAASRGRTPPRHRALDDARDERATWLRLRQLAQERRATLD